MPPKVKVSKEDIINAAVDIVRNNGAQAINARMKKIYMQSFQNFLKKFFIIPPVWQYYMFINHKKCL